MKYLIAGSGGQLAREFIRLLGQRSVDVIAPQEELFDITDAARVKTVTTTCRPDVVVNCAAYNLVDAAESEREKAMLVNAAGPRNLALAARACGARLVHFSSDYVFDGEKKTGLYEEGDAAAPVNAYGESKLAGEQAVEDVLPERALVLRLSWVFGEGSQNFMCKFLQRLAAAEPLKVTCDEFSVPTWTRTVAEVALQALERGLQGVYHVTNSGYCSRYEWARHILKVREIDRFVLPITMDSLALPARRPKFSAMNNRSIRAALGMHIPMWEEAVEDFLNEACI
jgi:dTDP-4-dehydrorhamnose reductase